MFEVFCGIDVARETHHAVALDRSGRRLLDRPLLNSEPDLDVLFEELESHGQVLSSSTNWPRSEHWLSLSPALAV